MRSNQFIKKIRFYALISFLLPLITINSCMFIYKFCGQFDSYVGFNWNEKKIEYTLNELTLIANNRELLTFANCPKYKVIETNITTDNQTIKDTSENGNLINNLRASNKIKSIIFKQGKIKNDRCVKNYTFVYLLLNNFSALDKILVNAKEKNPSGFANIKNPYFYGEVSISRTARFFPSILIFKTLIILSSILLFLYWKNNLNLFNELKNKNILDKFSNIFFYLGMLSCVFLILHAAFLGLDFDSKIFSKIRKSIIVLFILFEVSAQVFLTGNLYKFKEELKEYIRPLILKAKIIFVSTILVITSVAFIILAFYDPSTGFKHILEWNYFASLLFYYLLSRFLWMKK